MKKQIELLPPLMPNFITYKLQGVVGASNIEAPKIEVRSLTEEEAHEYAALMSKSFIEHWKAKREEKEKPIARDGKPWDGVFREDR
jgi:hypothetical protein